MATAFQTEAEFGHIGGRIERRSLAQFSPARPKPINGDEIAAQ